MKKEIIIAILLGLSLGLFITYGLYRTQNANKAEQTDPSSTTQPTPSPENLSTLVLHSPEDELIVATKELTIAGATEPNNFVVILVNETDTVTTADAAGAFSISTELEPGSNVIVVYSVDEDGKTTIEERVVVFTTKSLTDSSPLIEATATPSASPKAKSAPKQ